MILDDIIAYKKQEVALRKAAVPLKVIEGRLGPGVKGLLSQALSGEGVSLIAEVKKASPSKGVLKSDFDAVEIAACYEANGAAAISVLTDKRFFQGSLDYLDQVRRAVQVPILRKEFIIDQYQIYETAAWQAQALLLIAAVLSREELAFFIRLTRDLGMDALVEVHSRSELELALECGAEIIGINNRDLRTFRTDLKTTLDLAQLVPENCLLVSESGISTAADIKLMAQAGVDAVLVGEALVTSPAMEVKVRELAGKVS